MVEAGAKLALIYIVLFQYHRQLREASQVGVARLLRRKCCVPCRHGLWADGTPRLGLSPCWNDTSSDCLEDGMHNPLHRSQSARAYATANPIWIREACSHPPQKSGITSLLNAPSNSFDLVRLLTASDSLSVLTRPLSETRKRAE